MDRRSFWLSSSIVTALVAVSPAFSATSTIACRAPKGEVTRLICESPEYVAMDREIAALTDRAKTVLAPGELSQLSASTARYQRQREGCAWAAHNSAHPGAAVDECVRASMETRVRRLRDVVSRGSDQAAR